MKYLDLLNVKYKMPYSLLGIFLIFLVVIFSIANLLVCDVYNTYGSVYQNNIVVDIPIEYSDTIDNMEYLLIGDKKQIPEVLSVSEILLDSNSLINYQEFVLSNNADLIENMAYKITIYYNKEKVWEKLKKLII